LKNTFIKFLDREGNRQLVNLINVINVGIPIDPETGDEMSPIDGVYNKDGNPITTEATTTKIPLPLTFHSDPGHGWLEVPKELIPPEMKKKISGYSHQNETAYFLEEDCDAAPVHEYLKGLYDVRVIHRDYPGDAPCRNYRRAN
jgi:hypothetical protein